MKKLKLIALFLCSLFLLITFTACNNFRDRYFDDPQNIVASFKENKVLYDNLIHTILSSSKIQNHFIKIKCIVFIIKAAARLSMHKNARLHAADGQKLHILTVFE